MKSKTTQLKSYLIDTQKIYEVQNTCTSSSSHQNINMKDFTG